MMKENLLNITKGLFILLFLAALILGAAFLLPFLVHTFLWLLKTGWESTPA